MAVILQPDGSLAFLPTWMLDASAARYAIRESPTFSLALLQSLRAEIDSLLASLPSDSKTGVMAMPRKNETRENLQLGLLEQGPPDVELSPTTRPQLAALIEALMIEIAAALATQEVGDDQDHR